MSNPYWGSDRFLTDLIRYADVHTQYLRVSGKFVGGIIHPRIETISTSQQICIRLSAHFRNAPLPVLAEIISNCIAQSRGESTPLFSPLTVRYMTSLEFIRVSRRILVRCNPSFRKNPSIMIDGTRYTLAFITHAHGYSQNNWRYPYGYIPKPAWHLLDTMEYGWFDECTPIDTNPLITIDIYSRIVKINPRIIYYRNKRKYTMLAILEGVFLLSAWDYSTDSLDMGMFEELTSQWPLYGRYKKMYTRAGGKWLHEIHH